RPVWRGDPWPGGPRPTCHIFLTSAAVSPVQRRPGRPHRSQRSEEVSVYAWQPDHAAWPRRTQPFWDECRYAQRPVRERLDRHEPVQPWIEGAIDGAHAAFADFVAGSRTDPDGSPRKWHGRRRFYNRRRTGATLTGCETCIRSCGSPSGG